MLISDLEAPGSPSIMKFAAAAAAMTMLAGCAVTMPFPTIATPTPDWQSTDKQLINFMMLGLPGASRSDPRVANRRSKPIDDVRIDDDPPDFIVNGGNQVGARE